MPVSGTVCTFKIWIKMSVLALNLGFRLLSISCKESPEISDGAFEWTALQVRSWNPARLLWARWRHLGSGETTWLRGGTLARWVLCTAAPTLLILGSSSLSCEALLWGVWPGPSLKVGVLVLLPKVIFGKMEKTSLFLLLPGWCSQGDGDISLPSWAVPQRATRSEVFFCPQPFLSAETWIQPT